MTMTLKDTGSDTVPWSSRHRLGQQRYRIVHPQGSASDRHRPLPDDDGVLGQLAVTAQIKAPDTIEVKPGGVYAGDKNCLTG